MSEFTHVSYALHICAHMSFHYSSALSKVKWVAALNISSSISQLKPLAVGELHSRLMNL